MASQMRFIGTPEARFWKFVSKNPETGCWDWTGATSPYGRLGVSGKNVQAHRFAWELLRGPIPDGLHIDHRVCRNKACVNPDHLVVCTNAENSYQPDGDNLIIGSTGGRMCRVCNYNHKRKSWQIDPERMKAMQRQWREKNSDHVRSQQLEYAKANREKVRELARKGYHQRKNPAGALIQQAGFADKPGLMAWFRGGEYPQCLS